MHAHTGRRPESTVEALLAGQNRILEMIATNAPLGATLTSLVLLIESQFEGMLCSIVLLDEDGQHLLHAAAPSLPEPYRKAIDGQAIGPKVGSCGTAMFRREPVIVTDILTDPLWDDYRQLAISHGLRACWSTPIISHLEKILGSFAIYYREPRSPNPAEIQLTNVATRIAGIAIERWHADFELLRAAEILARDIAERKQSQALVEESEKRFRAVYERSPVGIALVDSSTGRFLSVNPRYCEIVGRTADEMLQFTFLGITHPDDLSDNTVRAKALTNGEIPYVEMEKRYVRPDGSAVWVNVSAAPLGGQQEPRCNLVMAQDITERKHLEKQLLQAQKMEAVGRLAGGIAHDFNNILGVILGQGELLLQKLGADDPSSRRIEQICQAGRRAASLTGQLLAFSRQQILRPASVDLNEIVENFSGILSTMIGEDVALEKHLDPKLGRIHADAGQIEQVIMNLVVNARDAMPQGGTITIRTSNIELDESPLRHSATKPGHCVMLTVSDTGAGMDEPTTARLFEPFFTTKDAGKGTGLGLATVYGIVKQSGGYILVDTAPAKGTTFSIFFPRLEVAVTPETAKTAPATALPARGSETILLVEDAVSLREVTREFLEEAGYSVLEAGNASEALETADRFEAKISLLITDVVLPGINGRALAERLASRRPGTKVLYISGYTDDATVRHGVLQSELAFLEKPFTQDALTHKVRAMLDTVA